MATLSSLGSSLGGSETSSLGRGRPVSPTSGNDGGPLTAYQCAFACMTEMQAQLSPSALQAKLEGLHQPLPSNYTTVSAKKRKNAPANRYSNVLPYDYNCIKVQPPPGSTEKGTYINASLLQASGSDPAQWRYIATQGPLPNTTEDFWNMVVDQECRAIVMLTRVAEDHATKCSQYFPLHEGETFKCGNVSVHCLSTMTWGESEGHEADLTLRNLRVVVPGKTDESGFNTMHYAFHCWPDHAAPQETRSVRSLMQAVNQVTENSGVACIHCSAGIGRTGTYIAIDIILKRLSALTVQCFTKQSLQQALDVDSVIRELRLQRMGMVQTVEQLEFIYTCLTDALREIVVASRTR